MSNINFGLIKYPILDILAILYRMRDTMKHEYGCCGHKPKKRPYGSKLGKFWCSKCDAGHVNAVNKKRARRKGKEECLRQMKLLEE